MLDKYIKKITEDNEVYIRIKLRPGAKCNLVTGTMDNGTIKMDVAEAAEKGRANQELIKFLAHEFAVSSNNVKIISGRSARIKLIKIVR